MIVRELAGGCDRMWTPLHSGLIAGGICPSGYGNWPVGTRQPPGELTGGGSGNRAGSASASSQAGKEELDLPGS